MAGLGALLASISLCAQTRSTAASVESARLTSDDECGLGSDDQCSLHALQSRVAKSLNDEARAHEVQDQDRSGGYKEVWTAKGTSFFDGFDFEWEDLNHGSAEYLLKPDAFAAGVVEAHGTHAILRAGRASPKYEFKRQTAKISTKASWKHFLMVIRYSHLPFGCGVWPAVFTMASGAAWPAGGEVDILEYVNTDFSKSSMHTGPGCHLDWGALQKLGNFPDRNGGSLDCETKYPNKLGCAPNKWMKNAVEWGQTSGVLAMERSADFVKIFYIPEHELPTDLDEGAPRPETWSRWLFSYYPLAESGCSPNVLSDQKLSMQINFCGDWASKVWPGSSECRAKTQNCRAVDPLAEYAPSQDCCTNFIWDKDGSHGTDGYLRDIAFFNVSHVQVFQ